MVPWSATDPIPAVAPSRRDDEAGGSDKRRRRSHPHRPHQVVGSGHEDEVSGPFLAQGCGAASHGKVRPCPPWRGLASAVDDAEAFPSGGQGGAGRDHDQTQEDTSAPSCASTTGSGYPRSGSSDPTARPSASSPRARPSSSPRKPTSTSSRSPRWREPPVCKLMDYGKFKYENAQKAREARRNQTNVIIKEMKLRPKIDAHDYETKKGHVVRFLKAGDKVKITIMFRGREQHRPELGFRLLQRLAEDVDGARLRGVRAQAGRPQHDHGARAAQEEGRGQGRDAGGQGRAQAADAPPRRPRSTRSAREHTAAAAVEQKRAPDVGPRTSTPTCDDRRDRTSPLPAPRRRQQRTRTSKRCRRTRRTPAPASASG